MKADLSRSTFDPARHFKRVLLQQGRVQTDADANEQNAILFHRVETEALDLIGGCGGPLHDAGFAVTAPDGALRIGAGRYYAGGRLVENEAEAGYLAQPHLPLDADTLAALGLDPDLVTPREGTFLAYLDTWEWHRTALDVPSLREVALGGPDTATRTRQVWQVRLHDLSGEEDPDCVTPPASWTEATAPSTGELGARAVAPEESSDPCIVAPGAGYRRLENQLYRVEVHVGGRRAETTLKWDRDNGSIVGRLEAQSPDRTEWTLSSVGRDAVLRFAPGDWAELTDDTRELHGVPGTLVQVVAVEGDVLTVDLATRLPAGGPVDEAAFDDTARVRRWNGVIASVAAAYRDLEDGVQVRLRAGNGADGRPRHYRTGDYWTIPARTHTGAIEWPDDGGGWVLAEGIEHHVCRLAIVTFGSGVDEAETTVTDCRRLFPPVTELTSRFYVGGDGQSGAPSAALAHPLVVGVANGSHPVEGARVRFEILDGGGSLSTSEESTDADGLASVSWTLGAGGEQRVEATLLDAAGDPVHLPLRFGAEIQPLDFDLLGGDGQSALPGALLPHALRVGVTRDGAPAPGGRVRFRVAGGGTVDGSADLLVPIQPDGTASVEWTLGPDGEQRVEATLLDVGGAVVHLPIHFGARISTAAGIAYTPADDCALPAAIGTVQDALDELCRREGEGCAATIGPSPLWQQQAQAFIDGAQSFHLCFQAGTYRLTAPLRIDGKSHVTITGSGPATQFEIPSAERVFDVSACESVRFAGFAAQAGFAGDERDQRSAEHLGGVLTVVGCPSVTVERVALRCAPGVRRAVTGITVRDHRSGRLRSSAHGSTRIRGCDIGIGHRQTGILVANVERAVIEDNRLYAVGRSDEARPSDVVAADGHLRHTLGHALMGDPTARVRRTASSRDVTTEDRARLWKAGIAESPIEVQARVGRFWTSFFAPESLANMWPEVLDANPLTEGDTSASAVHHVETLRARLLDGALPGSRGVIQMIGWMDQLIRGMPTIASQGIVVAQNAPDADAAPAPDVRIRDNRIEGCQQGIHVGASHAESKAEDAEDPVDRIDTVLVTGNTVDVSLSPETSRERHGIFVGNADHVTVQDNRIRVARTDPGAVWHIDGVRLYGHYGAMLLVRQNHVVGTTVGVRVVPLGDRDEAQDRHWYVSDNVAPGATHTVLAPGQVLQERNRPV